MMGIVARFADAALSRLGRHVAEHLEVRTDELVEDFKKSVALELKEYRRRKEDEVRQVRTNSNEFIVKVIELERRVNEAVRGIKVERRIIEKMLTSEERPSRMLVEVFRGEAETEIPEFKQLPEVVGPQPPEDQHERDLHSFLEDISSN